MNPKTIILVVVLALIGGSIIYFEQGKPKISLPQGNADIPLEVSSDAVPSTTSSSNPGGDIKDQPTSAKPPISMTLQEKAKLYPRAKEIVDPSGFINTEGITIKELIGKKVVLVDFWTYSCINCQRTTPYLNAWYEKYKDKGLEIVGVHTPEFSFEKEYENVKRAVENEGIQYPVVLDNGYGTWTAYGNRYWPRKYLIDVDGFIVYDLIGEGAYREFETEIQKLLTERMARLGMAGSVSGGTVSLEKEGTASFGPKSPEIYFGAARNTYLGNGASEKTGAQTLGEPTGIKTNILYLAGAWNFENEFAESKEKGAKIIFRYQGKDVFFVAAAGQPVRVRVMRDGALLQNAAGSDVKDGTLTVSDERLYKIVQDKNSGEHTLELLIEDPGLRAFTFTFG